MSAEDKRRCAQCAYIVLGVVPKMLQDILANTNIQPSRLYEMIMTKKKFTKILKTDERNALEDLKAGDFTKLDVGLMYKIFKTFNLIDEPTRDWGPCPLENETTIGDDVERIRRIRNHFCHKFDQHVSEQSFAEFFEEILGISKRLDKYLNKIDDSSYEKLLKECKLYSLDTTTEENLLRDMTKEGCFESTYMY